MNGRFFMGDVLFISSFMSAGVSGVILQGMFIAELNISSGMPVFRWGRYPVFRLIFRIPCQIETLYAGG